MKRSKEIAIDKVYKLVKTELCVAQPVIFPSQTLAKTLEAINNGS